MEFVQLHTGAKLPLVGLGTWQVKDDHSLSVSLRTALDNGYRLIDTAKLYQNEQLIGDIIHEYIEAGKLKREDLFITSKLPFTAHSPEEVAPCVEEQLKALRTDYIDLYLIHCPCGFKHQPNSLTPIVENGSFVNDETTHVDTWKALEQLHASGKLKALGLSNFNAEQIMEIYDFATVKPANLQVECHIYWQQKELRELCKKLKMTFTAYAPLGSPGRKAAGPDRFWPEGDPMTESVVREIAGRHHKTPAQILLRHLTQHQISVIPKSINPDRVVENISIFDFKLSDGEMRQLDAIDTKIRLFIMDFALDHPYFPFPDVNKASIPRRVFKLH